MEAGRFVFRLYSETAISISRWETTSLFRVHVGQSLHRVTPNGDADMRRKIRLTLSGKRKTVKVRRDDRSI